MLTAKVAQGQAPAPWGAASGEADAGEGADHAAGVDRRQAARVEAAELHGGMIPGCAPCESPGA